MYVYIYLFPTGSLYDMMAIILKYFIVYHHKTRTLLNYYNITVPTRKLILIKYSIQVKTI